MNSPRVRAALAAALALAVAPAGFTVAQFTSQVRAMTGQRPDDYSVRQGAYDLRKLRGKQLVVKPGRTRRYHVPELTARTIAALLTVRDKVIAPLIAGIRTPRRGRPPKTGTTSTAATKPSAATCKPSSAPRHHDQSGRVIDNELSITARNFLAKSPRFPRTSRRSERPG